MRLSLPLYKFHLMKRKRIIQTNKLRVFVSSSEICKNNLPNTLWPFFCLFRINAPLRHIAVLNHKDTIRKLILFTHLCIYQVNTSMCNRPCFFVRIYICTCFCCNRYSSFIWIWLVRLSGSVHSTFRAVTYFVLICEKYCYYKSTIYLGD